MPLCHDGRVAVTYESAVRKDEDDTYYGVCACKFLTIGWPTKKLAQARLDEHNAEHASAQPDENGNANPQPMRELVEFRAEHGLNGEPVTLVRLED